MAPESAGALGVALRTICLAAAVCQKPADAAELLLPSKSLPSQVARPCPAQAQLSAPTRNGTSVWRLVHRVAIVVGTDDFCRVERTAARCRAGLVILSTASAGMSRVATALNGKNSITP